METVSLVILVPVAIPAVLKLSYPRISGLKLTMFTRRACSMSELVYISSPDLVPGSNDLISNWIPRVCDERSHNVADP